MTALTLRAVVRSHRIVATGLLTLAVIALVCPNGPQDPGTTLASAALILVPVHAWTAHAAARALDAPTRDALVAAASARRLLLGQLSAAALLATASTALVLAAAVVSGVMSPSPTARQWGAGGLAAVVGITIGVAIGTATGPPFLVTRGPQVLIALLLLALTPEVLPVLSLARDLGNRAPADVLRASLAPVVGSLGAAAALLAVAFLGVDRLR